MAQEYHFLESSPLNFIEQHVVILKSLTHWNDYQGFVSFGCNVTKEINLGDDVAKHYLLCAEGSWIQFS